MKPLHVDKLFNTKIIINKLESSLNVNGQTEASDVAKKYLKNLIKIERIKGGGKENTTETSIATEINN